MPWCDEHGQQQRRLGRARAAAAAAPPTRSSTTIGAPDKAIIPPHRPSGGKLQHQIDRRHCALREAFDHLPGHWQGRVGASRAAQLLNGSQQCQPLGSGVIQAWCGAACD
eukprot:COSAG01_NODE_3504_length_5994_cov_47.750000_8_plen_110_part_00